MLFLKSNQCDSVDELLKMSLVPVACQECQLNADGCIISEIVDWLLGLQDKIPIWSRLLDINTSGFVRKLPLSMTKSYDIEVEGRLWSLWATKRKVRSHHKFSKSYIAITVMALCTARVMSLNGWNSCLMDIIKRNGRLYFKESLKRAACCRREFQLENLLNECNLEGIRFALNLKTNQKGLLYSTPLDCQPNLALALIHFFQCHQFGLLECCNRLLGFGFIEGAQGGYFMYDAQSFSEPIFPRDTAAPYLLRTNHLQVLLYCLVVALNVCHLHVGFCLHHVDIVVQNPYECEDVQPTGSNDAAAAPAHLPRLIPSELWKTGWITDHQSLTSESFTEAVQRKQLIESQSARMENQTQCGTKFQNKYHRKIHNITAEEVQQSLIKPLVDADHKTNENLQLKKDFVRMVCSDTVLPATAADLPPAKKEFSCNLLDALFMGPETVLKFKDF